jgi:hypothetical protein
MMVAEQFVSRALFFSIYSSNFPQKQYMSRLFFGGNLSQLGNAEDMQMEGGK